MLLFTDSFDHYATADVLGKWSSIYTTTWGASGSIVIGTGGRHSSSALKAYGDKVVHVWLPAAGATAIAGFAFKTDVPFPSNFVQVVGPWDGRTNVICEFNYLGAASMWFRIELNGQITAWRGGTTQVGPASTLPLLQSTWQYLEFKVFFHATAGTVEVRIDGAVVMALTGQNTVGGPAAFWDEFLIGPSAASSSIGFSYDDLVVMDGSGSDGCADFLGDVRVDAVFPNAPGTTSNGIRSTGSDQSATIDEVVANGDTDYNTLLAAGDKDTLNFPTAPVTGAPIKGLQVVVQARKTDAGAAGHKAVTRIAGTDYDGVEVGVPSSYTFLRQCWGKKPSDSSVWTDTDFNAAEFGYKKST